MRVCTAVVVFRDFGDLADARVSVWIFAEVVEHPHPSAMEGWKRAGESAAADRGADHGAEFYHHDGAGSGDGV